MNDLTNKTVVTRKDHVCEWCGGVILSGDKAQYRAYIFDDEFTHGWMHLDCHTAMNKSDSLHLREGWTFGENNRGEPLL